MSPRLSVKWLVRIQSPHRYGMEPTQSQRGCRCHSRSRQNLGYLNTERFRRGTHAIIRSSRCRLFSFTYATIYQAISLLNLYCCDTLVVSLEASQSQSPPRHTSRCTLDAHGTGLLRGDESPQPLLHKDCNQLALRSLKC